MQHDFWHEKWQTGKLGFHQERYNSRLVKQWHRLGLRPGDRVFVPLCGKSLDMCWLSDQGHPVLGLELSDTACREFFLENELDFEVQEGSRFKVFRGEGIELLCGDYFELTVADLDGVNAVYDRAALIALPANMRVDYASKMAELLTAGTPVLLISMDYNEAEMKGPPFSVTPAEIERLFSDQFDIQVLTSSSGPDIVGNLAERGLNSLNEYVYLLTKLP